MKSKQTDISEKEALRPPQGGKIKKKDIIDDIYTYKYKFLYFWSCLFKMFLLNIPLTAQVSRETSILVKSISWESSRAKGEGCWPMGQR